MSDIGMSSTLTLHKDTNTPMVLPVRKIESVALTEHEEILITMDSGRVLGFKPEGNIWTAFYEIKSVMQDVGEE